jgi:AcrR family transcriptional regulator
MARNDQRRAQIADAGLQVIATEGAKGLTHRAVDRVAGIPAGTTSNYFPTRDALLAGLVDRIHVRIAPDPGVLADLATGEPNVDRATDYVLYIVDRLDRSRDLALALFEVRLEAARRPELAERLGEMLREAFRFDVQFNASRGLPGEAFEIALLHYAIDGLMFDRLTVAIDPETSSQEVVRAFVERIVGGVR